MHGHVHVHLALLVCCYLPFIMKPRPPDADRQHTEKRTNEQTESNAVFDEDCFSIILSILPLLGDLIIIAVSNINNTPQRDQQRIDTALLNRNVLRDRSFHIFHILFCIKAGSEFQQHG